MGTSPHEQSEGDRFSIGSDLAESEAKLLFRKTFKVARVNVFRRDIIEDGDRIGVAPVSYPSSLLTLADSGR
jgi:hypothetical protein